MIIHQLKEIKKQFAQKAKSHKGQNGKVLIIGGSSLFHSASIWAAEVASYFVDIVHYSSTVENNEVFLSLKKNFHNGIIVKKEDIPDYVLEDDVVLVGPGMLRSDNHGSEFLYLGREIRNLKFDKLLKIEDETEYTYCLTKYLINNFPKKKFVFDAGALQMMSPQWLQELKTPAIVTPHQKEFSKLFGLSTDNLSQQEKIKLVQQTAKKYKTVILLKAIDDIISDGKISYVVQGGNQGLTKGGTGDLLAGLVTSFYTKVKPVDAAMISSWLLKNSAEALYSTFGCWYNIDKLIETVPQIFAQI